MIFKLPYSSSPTVPAGLSGVTAVAAGGPISLALKSDGTVIAWGWNAYGQTNVPVGLSGVMAISAGAVHTVALLGGGGSVATPSVTKVTVSAPSLPMPALAPSVASQPVPEKLASQFTSFYSANRASYDPPTQSFFDTEVIRLGQWLNSHKSSAVSNVFLKTADVIDIATHVYSIGSSITDLGNLSNVGLKALGSNSDQLYYVVSDGHDILNEIGISAPGDAETVAASVKAAAAAIDVLAASKKGGLVGALLSLNATIWGDFVVPQLRKYGQDPADPNYQTVVSPNRLVFGVLPSSGDARFDTLLLNELQSASDMGTYLLAANATIDKYSGALNAGDGKYATLQIAAFLSFMDLYDKSARQAAIDVNAMSEYLAAAGFGASNQNPALLTAAQQQVRQSGFSQSVLNYLQARGLSPSQIASAQQAFLALAPDSGPADLGFQGRTTAASMNLTSTIGVTSDVGRLINLSVLTVLASAGDTFTLGYVVGGSGTSGAKSLVIRAAGPSLGALNVPGTLADPKIELFAGSTKTGENDNWGGAPAITTAMANVGAFAYVSSSSNDAAAVASITTRDNSVKVSAADNGTGVVIAEVYAATPAASFTTSTPRLVNVSALKNIGSSLTAGFVIGGSTSRTVLIRAVGPTLGAAPFGVPGVVADPQLTLFSGQTAIGTNDNWGTPVGSGSASAAQLATAFAQVGAFTLTAGSKDAALLVTLAPGNYSVQISGVGGTTGIALAHIYEVP